MTPKQVGYIGEQLAKVELMRLGYEIFSSDLEESEYDFIAVKDNQFYPCQVKTTNTIDEHNSMSFMFRKTHTNTKGVSIEKYQKNPVFILVCIQNNWIGCYRGDKTKISIQCENSTNRVTALTNLAKDFQLSDSKLQSLL